MSLIIEMCFMFLQLNFQILAIENNWIRAKFYSLEEIQAYSMSKILEYGQA